MNQGAKIRRIRVFLDIGQATLSEKSGVNRSDLSLFEGGRKSLSPERVDDICKALGVESLELPLDTILIKLASNVESRCGEPLAA